MPNSLGTTPGTLIAQRALETLLEDFPILRLLSSDFSSEQAVLNQPLSIKLPVAFAAADEYTADDGYETDDADNVDIPLTISKLIHKTFSFNDLERNSFNTSLIEGFARNAAHAVGMSLVNDLLALITVTNFANETVCAVNDWTRQKFLEANAKLDLRLVPTSGRVALLNSPYHVKLSGDTTVVANPGSPSDAVRTGTLGNLDGVAVHKYAPLGTASENRVGFISIPEGIVLATRIPKPPESSFPGNIEVVSEPNTGISLLMRQWYNPGEGKEYRSYSLLTGVAKGIASGLERIVSASNT